MINIRGMRDSDTAEASQIFRLAFGTFLGLPDPKSFSAGREYILGPTMDLFNQRGVREAGLFTFVQSPKHLSLYQKFGFWPGFLIGVAVKPVVEAAPWARYTESAASDCRALTNSLFEGLDLSVEIKSVEAQGLGETVLVTGGMAICHCGEGTEAGPGTCYIKFACARGPREFQRLLEACEGLAFDRGLTRLETGVNFERIEAYQALMANAYRVERQALDMHRNGQRAYNRRDVYALDDWR